MRLEDDYNAKNSYWYEIGQNIEQHRVEFYMSFLCRTYFTLSTSMTSINFYFDRLHDFFVNKPHS